MKNRFIKVIYVVFGVYMIILLRITVFRNGFSFSHMFRNGVITFDFFTGYLEMLRQGMFYEFIYLFVGNIIWFVPFGFLLPCLCERPLTFRRVLFRGFLLSFTIELMQFAFGTGISEVDDLILNTLGALLGFCLNRLLPGLKRRGENNNE